MLDLKTLMKKIVREDSYQKTIEKLEKQKQEIKEKIHSKTDPHPELLLIDYYCSQTSIEFTHIYNLIGIINDGFFLVMKEQTELTEKYQLLEQKYNALQEVMRSWQADTEE